ncbi:MAG: 50S ribosomal protein L32 [Candidatus Eremiobacteraeota bacterium]|nr:50S ribosomal protein L32 [Candidatus Eremiobacteraeota bacterium]
MANPKYKTSHSKTRRRRANIRLKLPTIVECPRCHEMKLAHRVCNSCGFYKGQEVIKIEESKE